MEERSTPSAQKGKRRTAGEQEPKFGRDEALAIFNKGLQVLVEAGVPVQKAPLYQEGQLQAALILPGCIWDGNILAFSSSPAPHTGSEGTE